MEEVWKPIEHYNTTHHDGRPRFEVSNIGRVRETPHLDTAGRKYKERLLIPLVDDFGYRYVRMNIKDSMCNEFNICGLVAVTFLSEKVGQNRIRHKDGNPANNCVDNLEFVKVDGVTVERANWNEQMINLGFTANRPIRQYSFDGKLLAEYDMSSDIEEKFKVPAVDVESCCLKKPKGKLLAGYVWRLVGFDELFDLSEESRSEIIGVRLVRRYTRSGRVMEFASLEDASRGGNVRKDSIRACCERRQVTCDGCVWRYYDDDEFADGSVSVREYVKSRDKRSLRMKRDI